MSSDRVDCQAASTSPPAPLRAAVDLAARLSKARLRFVHWKSNSHLADALAGHTDIDLLADPAAQQAVRRELQASGAVEVLSQPWSSYPGVEDWLLMDEETGEFLHIHLHFAMMTGLKRVKHLSLPWADVMLAGAVTDKPSNWPVPAPEMELLTLLVRMWAKMPPMKRLFAPRLPRHISEEFRWLCRRTEPVRVKDLCCSILPGADAAWVEELVSLPAPSDAQVIAVARTLYAETRSAYRMGWIPALAVAARLNALAWAAKKLRQFKPTVVTGKRIAGQGAVITFIGSDGSGKSTVASKVSAWLKYKLDVHRYYMGSGDGGDRWLDILRRYLKSRVNKQKAVKLPSKKTIESLATPRHLSFLQKAAALHHLLLIRSKVKMLEEARTLARGGSIVILDRFPQSQFTAINDGPRLQNGRSFAWAARAEMHYFAKAERLLPDLVVKLIVSPETAYQRKPDHNLATMKLKCEIIRSLRFEGVLVVEIDADQPLDRVLINIKQSVWNTIRNRREGEPNALQSR